MYVIAGLGNPGKQYEHTKHNVGFDTLDYLAAQHRQSITIAKYNGLMTEGRLQGEKVLLVKPQTYMNASGECIRKILDVYGVPLENLIVIYDDMDIEIGKLRIRAKGSAGSHNGMKSVIYQLNSDTFPRIRIGIGMPEENPDIIRHVLGTFKPEQRIVINEMIERASSAAVTIVKAGIQLAMNRYNIK